MHALRPIGLLLGALLALPAVAYAQQPAAGEVELVTPGAAPQRLLRHRFVAGQTVRVRMRVRTTAAISLGGREQTVAAPRVVAETEIGPTQVLAGGRMRYTFRITRADLEQGGDAELRAHLQQVVRGLVGLGGATEIDDRGTVASFDFQLPRSASQELQQQAAALRGLMGQLLPRFPREPVGVGARWRIRDSVQLPQLSLDIVTTYVLRRWQGDRIQVDVHIGRADGGTERLPEGVAVSVEGSGRTVMRLGSLAMRQALESRSEITSSTPEGPAHIVLTTSQEVGPAR
jgi:hypothetical protein